VRFLADESCDFAVVRALRAAGHDVSPVAEVSRGADDEAVIALARQQGRILLTEDKDFGKLAYADGHDTTGVLLIRFPAGARGTLGHAIVETVVELGDRVRGAFVVVEPGRARLSRPRRAE
jgi:predicted nuclease of predicted toxin-antitoxin system